MPSSRKASLFSLEGREKRALLEWSQRFGLNLTEFHILRLNFFLCELNEWNEKINLTGPSSETRIFRELLLDSLIPCPFLPEEGALLDVGSGAGFPAIPIKICKPRLRVHLLEPNRRKCSFLKQVIRVTGLNDIDVLRARIEQGEGLLLPGGYQVITARAFMPMAQMLARCGPHLAEGGLIVLFVGKNAEELLADCRETLEAQACRVLRVIPYTLPGKGSQRNVAFLIKDPRRRITFEASGG